MSVQTVDLGLKDGLVRRQIAAVGLLGDDPQRAPLSGTSDNDRHIAHRTGIAGGLGKMHITAVVGLGAWRPKGSQCFDANRKLIKSFPVAGKVQAVRLVLPLPPAGAEPAESPPVAQYVQGRDTLGDDSRLTKGDRGDQCAELQRGVQAGDHAESDPWLGYRLPGTVDLRDLDQMVHECETVEAHFVSAERHIAEPGSRILFSPRKS